MSIIAPKMIWRYGSAMLLIALVTAEMQLQKQHEGSSLQDAISLLEQCGRKEISLCMKERALKYLDQLPAEMNFGGGLRIKQIKTDGEPSVRSAKFFNFGASSKDDKPREYSLNNILLDRIINYVSSHTFEFKMPEDTILEIKRSLQDTEVGEEEARRKKKKKKGLSLSALLAMKVAMLGALALKAIGIVAFKAFVMAKIALAIASMIALKKLLEQKHTSTYEVLAHPYEDHGHYDRSLDTDLDGVGVGSGITGGARSIDNTLPYRGYDKQMHTNF